MNSPSIPKPLTGLYAVAHPDGHLLLGTVARTEDAPVTVMTCCGEKWSKLESEGYKIVPVVLLPAQEHERLLAQPPKITPEQEYERKRKEESRTAAEQRGPQFDKASGISELVDDELKAFAREHVLGISRLTEAQFVQALKQALASGDFEVQVVAEPPRIRDVMENALAHSMELTHTQSVTYEPFRRVTELEQRITALEQELAQCAEQARVSALRKPV